MANARLYRFWGRLTEALRTGRAAERSEGRRSDVFGALYADPDAPRGFLQRR